MKRLILVTVILIGSGFLIYYFIQRTPFEETPPLIGTKAPEIDLADISGQMISLDNYKDRVIILNFWATWCPPCITQLKLFQKFYNKYEPKGLMVIAIALDDVTKEKVTELGLTFPVIRANERVLKSYGDISSVPATFVLDRNGIIVKKTKQYYSDNSLEEELSRLFNLR